MCDPYPDEGSLVACAINIFNFSPDRDCCAFCVWLDLGLPSC